MANVLAIIPARGGSKGIPNKNMREVAGKPLVQWSIEAAMSAHTIDAVVVSSDSEEILQVAAGLSGGFPLKRPEHLATDEASTDEVLVHAVEEWRGRAYWMPDFVVVLQPTSPIRPKGFVDRVVSHVIGGGQDCGFSAGRGHFVWSVDEAGTWRCNCDDLARRPRRQDMTPEQVRFVEDGSVYVVKTHVLLATRARMSRSVLPVLVDEYPDVDTEVDLWKAGVLLAALRDEGRLP